MTQSHFRYITKLNRIYTSDISFIAADANLGRLDSISIYSSSADRQSGTCTVVAIIIMIYTQQQKKRENVLLLN